MKETSAAEERAARRQMEMNGNGRNRHVARLPGELRPLRPEAHQLPPHLVVFFADLAQYVARSRLAAPTAPMDAERHARVKRLFLDACDIEPARRDDFLTAECAGDDTLRAEVAVLLAQLTESPTFAAHMPIPEALPLPSGSLIAGRYRIDGELGAGGMGRVYRATQLALNRTVAIKVISSVARASHEALARFEREAASVARLRHPHIVTVYDAGADEEAGAFYAMELVEGRSLSDELSERGVFPLPEAIEIMRQVASAVGAAHKAGVIHRDLKPANVMLDRSTGLVAKVLDFGLAKLVDGDAESPASPGVTTSGAVFGTPLYMSPEQARAEPVDARTDVWSLGVMMYELVAGTTPFRGPSSAETFVAILRREPEPLDSAAEGVPNALVTLVDHALRKDPADRLATAGEFERALDRLAENLDVGADLKTLRFDVRDTAAARAHVEAAAAALEPNPPSEPPEPPPKRNGVVIAVAVSVALLVAAFAGVRFMFQPLQPPSEPRAAAPAPAPTRSLAYALVVQKYRNGVPYEEAIRLSREILFERDYRIRVLVSSGERGFLYVLNEGPRPASAEPTFNILFPSPTTNGGRPELSPGVEVQLPERGWFRFDAERGTESLWLVWSEHSIAELDGLIAYANPKDLGAIGDPATARTVASFSPSTSRQSRRPATTRPRRPFFGAPVPFSSTSSSSSISEGVLGNMSTRTSRNAVPSLISAVIAAVALTSISLATARQGVGTERRIWDDSLTAATPKTTRRTAPRRRYRVAVPKVAPADVAADTVVGVTVWRLRAARAQDRGERLLVVEGTTSAQWIPERVSADSRLREGDRVRLTLEAARTGYLYVVDREDYADGTVSAPYLVFPTTRVRGGRNEVEAGRITEIPARDDPTPYFTLRRGRADQIGETLSVIITSEPIAGIEPAAIPFDFRTSRWPNGRRRGARTSGGSSSRAAPARRGRSRRRTQQKARVRLPPTRRCRSRCTTGAVRSPAMHCVRRSGSRTRLHETRLRDRRHR